MNSRHCQEVRNGVHKGAPYWGPYWGPGFVGTLHEKNCQVELNYLEDSQYKIKELTEKIA